MEATLMTKRGWARCTDSVADVLRRGAWYQILDERGGDEVVLDVRGRPVRFSREDLTIRDLPPETWSVVVRTGVLRPTLGGGKGREVVTTYAVCPYCAERQDIPSSSRRPPTLTCQKCGKPAPVDWSATC